MKKIFSFLVFAFCLFIFDLAKAQNIGIGTITPDSSAVLELQSTNSGFLPPRMTYSQRSTIANPATGLIVYCTDCGNGEMQFYNGTAWMQMTVAIGSVPYVVPTLETAIISSITTTSAVSGGNITANGGATVTARGVCWSTSANPTVTLSTKTVDGAGNGTFTSSITGLTANTTYYVRAYATNSLGTSYGTQVSFTTSNYSFVNLPSVTIGTQIWTTKNLDVAKYRNGDPIPQVTDATQWANLTTGAWCWYNNDSATYAATYGRLYNWYAVNDPRGIAPQGWHVPTNRESDLMTIYLDPTVDTTTIGLSGTNIGRQLKNTTGWNSGGNGTNSSGFAFLPGGARYNNGAFFSVGDFGYWWSASEFDTTFVWYRGLYNDINNSLVNRYYCNKVFGFSIRLVRD